MAAVAAIFDFLIFLIFLGGTGRPGQPRRPGRPGRPPNPPGGVGIPGYQPPLAAGLHCCKRLPETPQKKNTSTYLLQALYPAASLLS